LNSVVTLFSFLFILWTLSGILHIPLGGRQLLRTSPLHGDAAMIYGGRRHLVDPAHRQSAGPPAFNQQRYEADFRFSLVRLREHAESVAFYGGESASSTSSRTASPIAS